ncbi:hypothetical protein [Gandjariella thermophila]|uniref:hypothetical protein n=1 Tax=Gandjariella thermophila TaxID=1931992 RepID=UPI001CEF8E40|nr:hypothetical protein [Gandjariella thermophila]
MSSGLATWGAPPGKKVAVLAAVPLLLNDGVLGAVLLEHPQAVPTTSATPTAIDIMRTCTWFPAFPSTT